MRSYVGNQDSMQARSRRRKSTAGRVMEMQRKNKLPRGVAESLVREEAL